MTVPPELRNLVLLDLNYSDLIIYFESTNDPIIHDETFWKDKAERDLGISSDQFLHPNPVEAMIPARGHQRYIQIVSRDRVIKGSEQFLGIMECLYKSIKDGSSALPEYFLALPLIHDDTGEISEGVQMAVLYAGLELGSKFWVDRAIGFRHFYWDQDFGPISRAAGRGGSLRLLDRKFRLATLGYCIGTTEDGYLINKETPEFGIDDLRKYEVLQTKEDLNLLSEKELGEVLAKVFTLAEIKAYLTDPVNLNHLGRHRIDTFVELLREALRLGYVDIAEYATSRFDPEIEIDIDLSSKPTSFLAQVIEKYPRIRFMTADVLNVLELGFVNPATFLFLKEYNNRTPQALSHHYGKNAHVQWSDTNPHTIYTDGDFS